MSIMTASYKVIPAPPSSDQDACYVELLAQIDDKCPKSVWLYGPTTRTLATAFATRKNDEVARMAEQPQTHATAHAEHPREEIPLWTVGLTLQHDKFQTTVHALDEKDAMLIARRQHPGSTIRFVRDVQ